MFGRKLDFAILFRRINLDIVDFPVFFPDGAIIGKLSSDRSTFNDYLTGRKYLNIDLANIYDLTYGFKMALSINEIKESTGIKYVGDALRAYASEAEKQVYFFDKNLTFTSLSIQEFERKFNLKLSIWDTIYNRELIDKIIDDDISVEDFKKKYLGKEEIQDTANDKIKKILNSPICEIVNDIKETIIGQDDAIKELVTAIYRHLGSNDPNLKGNILLFGPSGSGKTAVIEELSKVIGIPVWIEDMTRYTASGYVGSSAVDILVDLYINAGRDIKLAEQSILFLDEIDKKSRKGKDDLDFNKKDVLNDLLKIIEGGVFYITLPDKSVIPFDTKRLIVIVGGAFSSLYEQGNIDKIIEGFNSSKSSKIKDSKDITFQDFKDYGMATEFLGRMKYIIKMRKLSVEDLIEIMKTGKKSPIKSYIDYFSEKGIELSLNDDIYERIAKLSYDLGTGARGLNLIINGIFNNVSYKIFDYPGQVSSIILGDNIIEDNNDYKLVRK